MPDDDIFDKTDTLGEKLLALIDLPLFDDSLRIQTSDVACSLSLEHWQAARALLQAALLPSALVVHRAQFEALTRSCWVLFAASDAHIAKLAATLTLDTERAAKNMPQMADMLADLAKKAHPNAYQALARFKDNAWNALNSYAHAGIHPIRRHAEGYPRKLLHDVLRNTNGLAVISCMQAAVLSGRQPLQRELLHVAAQYPECMPPPL